MRSLLPVAVAAALLAAAAAADVPADDSDLNDLPDEQAAHIRRKRQMSREEYQRYVNNINNPNFDPRYEEGWQHILYPYGKWVLDDQLMGQPGRETQANLGFDFPYFGFRFNYTFVYPMGMCSFARPPFIQPPFTFPNPLWPNERDHSFIAPFYADASFQWVGNVRVSNTWFRSVHRPRLDNDEIYQGRNPFGGRQPNPFPSLPGRGPGGRPLPNPQRRPPGFNQPRQPPFGQQTRVKRQMPGRMDQVGMVTDPALLNNITRDIQEGYTGANGWRAEHAFIVTWERMAYGGAPKAVDVSQFEWVKQWQNTIQLVIATDEIRSFAIFNYARVNWTSSNEAGGLNGFGGKQAAMAGFNGGNGTEWYGLPYTGHGRIWKLGYFSNVLTPGRWIHRIDEEIIPAGCSNGSIGRMVTSPPYGPMQGGIAVNVSGPCLREGDFVKVTFENWQVDCARLNRIRARCVMPRFHKVGLVSIRMSRDGGQSYPFYGVFYVLQPHRAPPQVLLRDDVQNHVNRWYQPYAETLTVEWQALNLTHDRNARVDISLIGYWEDADRSHFTKIDVLNQGAQPNIGFYQFTPKQLVRNPRIADAWKNFHFGFVQVSLTDREEDGVLWSLPTPFSWYHLPYWERYYGRNWATDLCIDWFEYDGRRRNFQMDLTWQTPCPCMLDQALVDLGRFMPLFECDMDGDASCPFNKGSKHCIQSVQPSWTGSAQQCCYNYEGYLMFSDDWEPTGDYTRFFNPGTPVRAHAFGSYPFRRPPRIPGLSHYQLDLMPYRTCCNYADHCEFYYWRRQTNGCQNYRPPGAAYMYGEPHVVTFDGLRYTFPGKGYYVLLMSEDPLHRLMIQVRLEQPDETLWRTNVNATVVTAIAVQENDSAVVQVLARKPFQRWRYKTDIYVNGDRRFFDKPHWKLQQFQGVQIRNPKRNMNHSEIIVMLDSGAGIRISESYGMLDVMVFLPPSFNSSCDPNNPGGGTPGGARNRWGQRCYITKGLLGAYNGDKRDDLMKLDGSITTVPENTFNRATTQQIYEQFGLSWRVTGADPRVGPILIQDRRRPIYNPLLFASRDYRPEFFPDRVPLNATLIFSMEQVRALCAENPQCIYDYLMTGRREVAETTLDYHNKFIDMQRRGSRWMTSCGPLLKKPGVIKTPPSQNYLDGDVVTFSCKPDFFIHGEPVRRCVNGTWSPGWWVWCRERDLEYFLIWLVRFAVFLFFVLFFAILFCCCWRRRVRLNKKGYRAAEPMKKQMPPPPLVLDRPAHHGEPPPAFNGDSFDHEPKRVGLAGNGASSARGLPKVTTA